MNKNEVIILLHDVEVLISIRLAKKTGWGRNEIKNLVGQSIEEYIRRHFK